MKRILLAIIVIIIFSGLVASCQSKNETTIAPIIISTPVTTAAPTQIVKVLPTATPTPTATQSPTPMPTPTPKTTLTPVPTPVPTPTLIPTPTPKSTPTPTPKPTAKPTITPIATPTPTPTLKDIYLTEIATRIGAYGDAQITDVQDYDTFTMTVIVSQDLQYWGSVGIDIPRKDLSGYRFAIVRVKGLTGGEEFEFRVQCKEEVLQDFYSGLSTQWQTIVFDTEKMSIFRSSAEVMKETQQIAFEIGSASTHNKIGTSIIVDGIWFTNKP